jgi:hypothetical protein
VRQSELEGLFEVVNLVFALLEHLFIGRVPMGQRSEQLASDWPCKRKADVLSAGS